MMFHKSFLKKIPAFYHDHHTSNRMAYFNVLRYRTVINIKREKLLITKRFDIS